MPTLALVMVYSALIARMTRASMLDVLAQDYIPHGPGQGLGSGDVLIRHALKNAAVPIVTIIGMGIADWSRGSWSLRRYLQSPGWVGLLWMRSCAAIIR